jgi:glycosyltransferase involved in cell wall biosynthesis
MMQADVMGRVKTQGRRRRQRYDVVFYTPFVGWMLSPTAATPPGGAETQILMLAKTLARRGLRVAIIAYGESAELPDRVEGVQIVPRPTYKLGRKRVVGKVLESFRIWQALWRVPSRTVIYRCASLELGLVALYTKCSRRRLIFSTANVVDFDFGRIARARRDVMLYHLGIRLADAVVVQTDEQVQLCEAAFGKRPHLIRSLSPVFGSRPSAGEAFLWIGRLVWYKQPLAYITLAKAVPEARFWMVGVPANDKNEAALAEQVKSAARATPNLELLDPRPHAQLGELMERAVASVNTASFEGMPNVLLEAWSRGVPALVLNHDPGEVVTREGLGGFAAGSPDRFVELARELWEHRSDRADLAQRCLAYVEAHHSPDAAAERWAAVMGLSLAGTAREPQAPETACVG